MLPDSLSLEERQALLEHFLARYHKRGFHSVSRSPTTAELFKPAHFPMWLFHAQTLFIDIDERGCIYIRKA